MRFLDCIVGTGVEGSLEQVRLKLLKSSSFHHLKLHSILYWQAMLVKYGVAKSRELVDLHLTFAVLP